VSLKKKRCNEVMKDEGESLSPREVNGIMVESMQNNATSVQKKSTSPWQGKKQGKTKGQFVLLKRNPIF